MYKISNYQWAEKEVNGDKVKIMVSLDYKVNNLKLIQPTKEIMTILKNEYKVPKNILNLLYVPNNFINDPFLFKTTFLLTKKMLFILDTYHRIFYMIGQKRSHIYLLNIGYLPVEYYVLNNYYKKNDNKRYESIDITDLINKTNRSRLTKDLTEKMTNKIKTVHMNKIKKIYFTMYNRLSEGIDTYSKLFDYCVYMTFKNGEECRMYKYLYILKETVSEYVYNRQILPKVMDVNKLVNPTQIIVDYNYASKIWKEDKKLELTPIHNNSAIKKNKTNKEKNDKPLILSLVEEDVKAKTDKKPKVKKNVEISKFDETLDNSTITSEMINAIDEI